MRAPGHIDLLAAHYARDSSEKVFCELLDEIKLWRRATVRAAALKFNINGLTLDDADQMLSVIIWERCQTYRENDSGFLTLLHKYARAELERRLAELIGCIRVPAEQARGDLEQRFRFDYESIDDESNGVSNELLVDPRSFDTEFLNRREAKALLRVLSHFESFCFTQIAEGATARQLAAETGTAERTITAANLRAARKLRAAAGICSV